MADQVLQAVKFTDKNASGLSLVLDEEFQAADCFSELGRGYAQGVVDLRTVVSPLPVQTVLFRLFVLALLFLSEGLLCSPALIRLFSLGFPGTSSGWVLSFGC